MSRRIDRPPKRIVIIGAYLLLLPQIVLLAYAFFVVVGNVAHGGKKWTFEFLDESITSNPDALVYECAKVLIVGGLLWLYSAILYKITRRAIWSRHQRLSLRANHCPHCNYDVRASPDRCSECGHALR